MIKINISNLDPELQQGLKVLEKYNFVQVCDNGIKVKTEHGEALKIKKREDALMITYDTRMILNWVYGLTMYCMTILIFT